MPSHGCLTPDADEVLKHCRTRNTNLGYDDATPAEDNVVADLHQIIETGTSTDHGVSRRSSINRSIGANFDIVFKNYPPKLGNREKSSFGGGESKSFLTDPCAGIYVDACS
jgi:hypothetical protein